MRADPGLSMSEGVQSKDVRSGPASQGRSQQTGPGEACQRKPRGTTGFTGRASWLRGRAVLSRVVRNGTTDMPDK